MPSRLAAHSVVGLLGVLARGFHSVHYTECGKAGSIDQKQSQQTQNVYPLLC